ncbi:MAG TPA: flavodoxin domain-containing protein [Actinophytocola sp.]|jgi:menaquinone-dependent protoporphyrinogen oxidase|uniref:flavodoxin domain-containing protein n=1 Tax=Actinophytocola sp. TaxID=1872138 RepID=UPI002F93D4CF
MTRVLVTYASKMGSTKEIAEAIGGRLLERGFATDVSSAEAVGSIDGYDAVVVGSAVYATRWRREATRFVRRFRQQLAARKVWLFESGWVGTRPSTLVASPGARRRASRLGAPAPAVFGGRLDPDLATGPLDRALANGLSGDARDWDEIRSWSDSVADALADALADTAERVRKEGRR